MNEPDCKWNTILEGDAQAVLEMLPEKTVQCCVTSPPYFGLRSYLPDGHEDKCAEIGLEETPEQYVNKLVQVFREVRRVLRDDGVLFLNLGDSYAGSGKGHGGKDHGKLVQFAHDFLPVPNVGTNFLDCLQRLMEGQPLIFGDATTIRITAKSGNVPLNNNGFPYGVFLSLLGIERVTVKQRDNDFCQVFNILTDEGYCWIGCPVVSYMMRDMTDVEIVLDAIDGVSIIISDLDTDIHSILGIDSIGSVRTGKECDSSFTVKEAHKPISKCIRDIEPIGDAITFDAPLKRFPDIYLVDKTIPLRDRFDAPTSFSGNFSVTHASVEQFCFSLANCGVDIRTSLVSHVFTPNQFGSVVCYTELYDKAKRKSSTLRPKQELGIPFMVRQSLMEDGWICRSTIIWHKPNCMPESVKDRPTKSHEYLFLLSKQERYYYDADSIREPHSELVRRPNVFHQADTPDYNAPGAKNPIRSKPKAEMFHELGRNKRSVWAIPTAPLSTSHFATMPPKLVEPCILAGSRPGDLILDPFAGAGTTLLVAASHGRNYLGIELNADYIKLAQDRLSVVQPQLWSSVA